MAFFLFLLVNATLFVRPMEVFRDLEGVKLYEIFILSCLLLALPEVLTFFATRSLRDQPIALCVFGLFFLTLFAQITNPGEMLRAGEHFGKVMIYYILALSLLNSPGRIRVFLVWLLLCLVLLTTLTILQYHGVIQISRTDSINKLMELEIDKENGKIVAVGRLQGTGIFADPNEFCGMLAAAIPLCFWALGSRHLAAKALGLALLGLSFYGIALTRSRGGFLGLLGGLFVMMSGQLGLRKTLWLCLAGLPLLFLAFGGRQTEISAREGTGQTRVQLWSEWLSRFRDAPLTGNGLPLGKEEDLQMDKSADELGLLAHNSYLQAFADWGFVGGALFIAAFVLALWGVGRLTQGQAFILDPQLRRLQPFLLGALAGYAVSILSLSMTDRVPTYFMLALAGVFPLFARSEPPVSPPRVSPRLIGAVFAISIGFLAFLYVFVRVFVSW
jgi:putative inorganic carbon (HCO3(-)) transporter